MIINITQAAIIRPHATWYELGEKKILFSNLEKSNKKNSCVRKIFTSEGKLTHDAKKVLKELESFYSNLCDAGNCADSVTVSSFLNDSTEIRNLTEDLRDVCEGKLGYGECCSVLQTF